MQTLSARQLAFTQALLLPVNNPPLQNAMVSPAASAANCPCAFLKLCQGLSGLVPGFESLPGWQLGSAPAPQSQA